MKGFILLVFEVFSITIPIFAVIAIGYFIRRRRIIKNESVLLLNRLAYNLGLPSLIFISIIRHKFSDIFNVKIVETIFATFIIFIIITVWSFYFIKTNNPTKSAMIVSSFRCNMAFIGFPIILSAYGSLAAAKASLVVAFLIPFNIIVTIIIFKFFNRRTEKTKTKRLLLSLGKDPLILSAVFGIVFSYFNIYIPVPVVKIFDILSGMAVAIALIAIGSSFEFFRIRENIKFLSLVSFFKLIILPAAALMFSMFVFKVDSLDRNVICLLSSMPVAVVTFIMGKEHHSDYDFISQALIVTTVASSITISFWLLILKLI